MTIRPPTGPLPPEERVLDIHSRREVRRRSWSTDEPVASIADDFRLTELEVYRLAHWDAAYLDPVPEWARPSPRNPGRTS